MYHMLIARPYIPFLFYASAAKRAKALCSRVVRPSDVRPSVRPVIIFIAIIQ